MELLHLLFIEKEASFKLKQSFENNVFKSIQSAVSLARAETMIAEHSPDMIIIDLDLDGKYGGLDVAGQLYEQYGIPFLFSSTSNIDSSLNELVTNSDALGYLKKPFSMEDLQLVVKLGLKNFEEQLTLKKKINRMRSLFQIRDNDPFVFIRTDYQLQQIKLKDIIYVEAVKDYMHIHCDEGIMYSTHATMKQMERILPDYQFTRIHRSYIARLDRIKQIKYPEISLEGTEDKISVGGLYRKSLLAKLPIV